MDLNSFNLHEDVIKGIKDTGFTEFMPVQEKTFAESLSGRDVMVQSQTGSGKTAAFLITVFNVMMRSEDRTSKKALVVVPTRELAVQIEKEAELLGRHLGIKTGSFYGGVGYGKQEALLKDNVQLIIGTPGRLIDFANSGKLDFKSIDMLVIDEADRLFDMGFFPDIKRMLKKMKDKNSRQTMLFSATLNFRVRNLAWDYMNDPAEILLAPDNITVDNISQELYHVGTSEKINLLLGLMKKLNPSNAIVFANTKQMVFELSKRLAINGYKVQYIIGDLPQSKRLDVISKVKSGEVPFLVATDVAARGLHVDDLELVINYDIPEDCENYVHRIGRTARAGKTGRAISLSCEKYVYGLEAIERYTGIKIPVVWAEESDYADDASAGMRFRLNTEQDKREKGGKDRRSVRKRDAEKLTAHRSRTEKPRVRTSGEGQHQSENKSYPKAVKVGKDRPDYKKVRRPNTPQKKGGSLEDRLQYYSSKYGEDFKPVKRDGRPAKAGKGILNKIASIFKRGSKKR